MDLQYCSPRHLAELYLQYGSVEEALKEHADLPISVADFHRKVKDFGIIKGVGRRTVSLTELLYFFANKVTDPELSIEKLYRIMPLVIRESTSLATLHRIYQQISERMVRTYATALILTNEEGDKILTAEEKKENLTVGKIIGSKTIPMTFGIKNEPFKNSILRVLQREFSTVLTLEKKLTSNSELTKELIPDNIQPIMYLHLLDVEVSVFHIILPRKMTSDIDKYCSSYKVGNYQLMTVSQILNSQNKQFRIGIKEIVEGYQNCKNSNLNGIPTISSLLNQNMLTLIPSK